MAHATNAAIVFTRAMHPNHSRRVKFKGAFGFGFFAPFSAIFAFSDSSFFQIDEVEHESNASLSNIARGPPAWCSMSDCRERTASEWGH
jgi:hypothetical protein